MLKHERTTTLSIKEAEDRVTQTLKEQGFGVLTRIDVQAKLKEKLDENIEPYTILGACSPKLAHQALEMSTDNGYLLPCNVLIYIKDGKTHVGTVLPTRLLSLVGEEAACIAKEAEEKLKKAIDAV